MKKPTTECTPQHQKSPGTQRPHVVVADLTQWRRVSFTLAVAALVILTGAPRPADAASAGRSTPPAGPVRFAVLSDLHFYDVKLGVGGTAFDNYLAADPKLLHLSEPILDAAVADLMTRNVRFVIISGDLTKDGEILNHVRVTQYLQKLEQAGIEVFVVPGNHDINNADAVEYRGEKTKPVPSASPEVFRAIYQRFGYG
jgi:predicted MPP superfamily phosphohydrolase